MKILYKPFAIIASLIGAKLGRSAFKNVWAKIDASDPPDPTTAEASFTKVVGAAALEAATMAAIGAAVDRASARGFHYLTGIWPGKKRQEPPGEP
jgi:predicted DNA-binding transcriptional regulator YafY